MVDFGKKIREKCEDCKALIKEHGEENLKICTMCFHYYYSEGCSCRGL